MPFSGLAPQNWNNKKKIGVGYGYIEESFDTIFNMGYVYIEESFDTIFNIDYGSRKSAMDERVKAFV